MRAEGTPHAVAAAASRRGERPEQPEPFLRGVAWPGIRGVPYPRAQPDDRLRLPGDTWRMACVPVGVRVELVGDATAVRIAYRTGTAELGYRGAALWKTGPAASPSRPTIPSRGAAAAAEAIVGVGADALADFEADAEATADAVSDARARADAEDDRLRAGEDGGADRLRCFSAWSAAGLLGEARAEVGEGSAELPRVAGERTIVYVPELMRPTVLDVAGLGGDVEPAPLQPRWVVYGDSVAEGWVATAPALAWPAIAGREMGLDVVNLGYAGAARGEVASAEQVAALDADLLTVCHGTNCWTRTPHSADLFRAGIAAFLDVLRQGHPTTPLLVVSPVVRPDAEETPNRLGATLVGLRAAMEAEVRRRIDAGDAALRLLPGRDLIGPEHLGDGIHPDDAGHRRIAAAVAAAVADMIG